MVNPRLPRALLSRASLPRASIPRASLPKATIPKLLLGEEREKITPAIRRAVWEKRFGTKGKALCYCCKKNWIYNRVGGFECGHKRSLASHGSNKPSNLEPICSQCNKLMQNHNLESWCAKRRKELMKETIQRMNVKTKPKTESEPKKKTVKKKSSKK